jgi:hypothetical protein
VEMTAAMPYDRQRSVTQERSCMDVRDEMRKKRGDCSGVCMAPSERGGTVCQ